MTVDYSAVLVAKAHAAEQVRLHRSGERLYAFWVVEAIGLYGHLLDLHNQGRSS